MKFNIVYFPNSDITALKAFKHMDSSLQGVEPNQNITTKGNNFGANTNPSYATPDRKSTHIEANPVYQSGAVGKINHCYSQEEPGYATPDIDKGKRISDTAHHEPGYETPDIKRKEENRPFVHSEYDTPEGNDSISDPTYSMPDKTKKEDDDDIKRVEINGDFYALPDKDGKKVKKLY